MGMAGRLTHHVHVSRRRSHNRRKPLLRRITRWPSPVADVESLVDTPSRFLTPLAEVPLGPRMMLGESPGEVRLATVIDVDARDAGEASREPSVLDMPLAQLHWRDPFHWLALGWQDFKRTPSIGLFFGACFVLMGWLLVASFERAAEYTLMLSASFLLLGPFLCLGMYQVSRQLERNEPVSLWSSLTAWRINSGQVVIFAGVLLVLEMIWARAAMVVFAVCLEGMPDFSGPVSTWLTEEMMVFLTMFTLVGAVFAGLIYAASVISMPMIMDRSVDAISAGLASIRLVATQPGVMLLWAGLITVLAVLAMLPGFIGLLVVGPMLGHASWHAYRAAMNAQP